MRNSHGTGRASRKEYLFVRTLLFIFIVLACAITFLTGCSGGPASRNDYVYVTAPEASLWDRVAAIHAKTGLVHNGERLQVVERMPNRRFVRVRSPRGEEGWLPERYLTDQRTFDQFLRLADQYKATPAQASATTEQTVNLHILPGRKTEHLYQLNEKQKVQLLQRQTVDRNATPVKDEKPKDADAESSSDDDKSDQPAIWEDWWLIRDEQQHVGWALGRLLYLDVPEEIAQYAEGQRIVAVFPLDEVQDRDKKITQYLTVLTEPKDGMPYDFDQVRVYTWNTRKHRYETAYRERVIGALPVALGRQDFEKEGSLRTFTLQLKDKDDQAYQQVYKFNPPLVRKVFAPGEKPPERPKKSPTRHKKRPA
jgi:hypothetical protein